MILELEIQVVQRLTNRLVVFQMQVTQVRMVQSLNYSDSLLGVKLEQLT